MTTTELANLTESQAAEADAEAAQAADDNPADLAEPENRLAADHGRVTGDLVASGHGYQLRQLSNPDLPEHCIYCGERLIPPAEEWPCEAGPIGDTFTNQASPPWMPARWAGSHYVDSQGRPIAPDTQPRSCACSGCETRRMGIRKRGGQPRQCGAPECRKARDRDRQRRYRKRKREREALSR